jgi:Domain of unknown function (DUF4145)
MDFSGPRPEPSRSLKLEGLSCLTCGRELPPLSPRRESLSSERSGEIVFIEYFNCPFCSELTALMTHIFRHEGKAPLKLKRTILPIGRGRRPVPNGVPASVAQEYREACEVLEPSARASAAMSRRCLQSLLSVTGGAPADRLDKAIDQVIDRGELPSILSKELDAVREIGNFAAHPMKSEASGVILDVEPGEAEWNLTVLEHLFDFYYVDLPEREARRAALNEKLKEAGRRPLDDK